MKPDPHPDGFRPVSFVDDALVEMVEGVRYSAWRAPEGPKQNVDVSRWRVALIAYCVLMLIAILLVWRLGGVKYLGFVSPLFVGGPLVLVTFLTRDLRSTAETLPPRPEGVPQNAVPMTIGRCYGRSKGWLWTDGPWVIFHGDRFDFRLHPGNFEDPNRVKAIVTNQSNLEVRLSVPKGHPTRFFFTLGYQNGLHHYRPAELAAAMRASLAECLTYDRPVAASLFPPYRRPREAAFQPPKLRLRDVLAISLVGGIVNCIVPIARHSPTLVRFLGGFGALFLILGLLALSTKLPPYNERIPESTPAPPPLPASGNEER